MFPLSLPLSRIFKSYKPSTGSLSHVCSLHGLGERNFGCSRHLSGLHRGNPCGDETERKPFLCPQWPQPSKPQCPGPPTLQLRIGGRGWTRAGGLGDTAHRAGQPTTACPSEGHISTLNTPVATAERHVDRHLSPVPSILHHFVDQLFFKQTSNFKKTIPSPSESDRCT